MDEGEADKDAILAVLRSETEAWLQRDFETLAKHWVQSPQTRRMEYYASLGVRVDEGWDVIAARLKRIVERFPHKRAFSEYVRWKRSTSSLLRTWHGSLMTKSGSMAAMILNVS